MKKNKKLILYLISRLIRTPTYYEVDFFFQNINNTPPSPIKSFLLLLFALFKKKKFKNQNLKAFF